MVTSLTDTRTGHNPEYTGFGSKYSFRVFRFFCGEPASVELLDLKFTGWNKGKGEGFS